MIGMIQILTYLLAVYLVFKGVEILQIALMSNRTDRTAGIVIGIVAVVLDLPPIFSPGIMRLSPGLIGPLFL
jgi:hypothetical protein